MGESFIMKCDTFGRKKKTKLSMTVVEVVYEMSRHVQTRVDKGYLRRRSVERALSRTYGSRQLYINWERAFNAFHVNQP